MSFECYIFYVQNRFIIESYQKFFHSVKLIAELKEMSLNVILDLYDSKGFTGYDSL